MHKKLLDILVNFAISLKDGVVEPFRNLVFDIRYDLLDKSSYENIPFEEDIVEEEKPKKKKGRKKKSK
jgi:hypothetical protein